MDSKKDKIKNGENLDLDSVTIINNVSVAEKAEEKVVEEPTVATQTEDSSVMPEESKDVEIPDVQFSNSNEENVQQTDLPLPEVSVAPVEVTSQAILPGFNSPTLQQQVFEDEIRGKQNIVPFTTTGVYKSTSDVDMAAEEFIKDVKEAYAKNISNPTKKIVDLLNDFKQWGNKVTSQGLNRQLFEEFDNLCSRYDGLPVAEYGDDTKNEPSYSDNQNNQNFGGFGGMNF